MTVEMIDIVITMMRSPGRDLREANKQKSAAEFGTSKNSLVETKTHKAKSGAKVRQHETLMASDFHLAQYPSPVLRA